MTDASMVRSDRFNPDSPVWDDAEDGELWRVSSPKGSPIEWRCTLRWNDGGWTQVVGLEFGPAVLGGFDISWNDAARSEDPTRGKPVAFPPIDPQQIQDVVRTVMHAARDAEAARIVARATRAVTRGESWDDWLTRLQGPDGDRVRKLDDASDPVQRAATLYALFHDRGVANPTVAVAQVFMLSRATASRLIRQARDRGLLGAARPGAAGEFSRDFTAIRTDLVEP